MNKKQNAAPTPSSIVPKKDEVLYLPLGGAGQIGMNMYMYGHAGKWLMVDCGMSFAHEDMPGVEIVIPNAEFAMEHADRLAGIVITHGHEDHIGALPYLWEEFNCPIYATAFTAELIRAKFDEAGINAKKKLNVIPLDSKFKVDIFDCEFVSITHSIPESNALVIKTGIGTIVHSGDWKLDPTPQVGKATNIERFKQLGAEGVLALTCDSTNVLVAGHSGSEADVRREMIRVVGNQKGKVAVTCFASNVARMESAAIAAAKNDRHVVLAGRSIMRIYDIAVETGQIKPFENIANEDQAGYFPDDKILYICTGCQGEPRSAIARVADRTHPFVRLGEGDSVIFSSRVIPGNEVSVHQIENNLSRLGVEVITADMEPVHVSGHPCRDELIEFYQWLRPKMAIPMHGESRHLASHVKLAKECQTKVAAVVENGMVARLTQNDIDIVSYVEVGQFALDGTQFVPADGALLREKRKLIWSGGISITLVLGKNGSIASDPAISLFSLLEPEVADEVIPKIQQAVVDAYEDLSKSERRDDEFIAEQLKRAARQVILPICGKKPVADVHIIRV
jgi:ribonuclease J